MDEMALTFAGGSAPVSPTTPFTLNFSDMDSNELLNAFNVDDDNEDFPGFQHYFNDSVFDFNGYIDESQYEHTSTPGSTQEPQKDNDKIDDMNLQGNSTVLANSTNTPEVATTEVTAKAATTNVTDSSSPRPTKPQGLHIDTAVSNPIESSDGLHSDTAVSNPINGGDTIHSTSNPEQPATFESHSTNSNALLDQNGIGPVSTAQHRLEEAGPTDTDINEGNNVTSVGENTNQGGQSPFDLNFFDGLFDDSNDWRMDGADTSGWNLNDWGIEGGAQGMLPVADPQGSPSIQTNLAHQSNGESFLNAFANDASTTQANPTHQFNGESFFNAIDNDASSAQATLAHQSNGESFFNANKDNASSVQGNLAHQNNAEPFFNAIDNSLSSVPGTSTRPELHGLLPNSNTQGKKQVLVEQSQNTINQSLHQHAAPQTSRAEIRTTTVAHDIGVNARGTTQQRVTQQPTKSSQSVVTQAGTIAGSPKQQVNRNMRMPAKSTSNDHLQQPTQRNVTGSMANAHLDNMNGYADPRNINGHTYLPNINGHAYLPDISGNAHLPNTSGNAHLLNINGHTVQGGQNPNNGHSQQRSNSLPSSEGSSKEDAIDLISPVAATFNGERATSHVTPSPTPSISRQPVNNSHSLYGMNSHGSLYSQRSPGSAHHRQLQQMTPRSQSNLRHMSVPAQSMGQSQASNGTGYQLLSSQMSSSAARPSIEVHQQPGLLGSNGGHHLYSQGYGSNGVAERIFSGRGENFTGPKVNDLRAQSLSNDATHSQHRLSHSPRSNLGNHHVLTKAVFQSPQQRQLSLLNQPHALALQHLLPLQGVPRSSVLPNSLNAGYTNNSMKHETSSPESANGALNKLNKVPQHDSHRASQVTNFQTPNNATVHSPGDQRRIELLYNAMMDMSNPQDNEGMLKTWRGLMKEKAKIMQVCTNVLSYCYKLEYQGSPLQQAIKSQNNYEGLDSRVHSICEAFEGQKTMCKHLMEAPYLYQVVDDPILAANRVINNRKVNKNKKVAIEAGREALKAVNPHETGDTGSDFGFYGQNEDDDAEGDDDDDYGPVGQNFLSSVSPSSGLPAPSKKRAASNGATYRASTPKKVKRSSKYQLNAIGEMVEVNPDDTPVRMRQGSQGTPQQQPSRRGSAQQYQNAVANNFYHGNHFNPDYNVVDGIHQGQDRLSGPGGFLSQQNYNYSAFRGHHPGNGQQDRQ